MALFWNILGSYQEIPPHRDKFSCDQPKLLCQTRVVVAPREFSARLGLREFAIDEFIGIISHGCDSSWLGKPSGITGSRLVGESPQMVTPLNNRRIGDLARFISSKDAPPVERVKAVHDWIILNTAYDVETYEKHLAGKPRSMTPYRMEGVFDQKLAVCAGYSEAAKALLEELEIETIIATNEEHAWNMVKLGEKWFHLDVTYDDPIPDEPGRVVYGYFLLSNKTLAQSRTFTPARPATDDYFAGVNRWNGRPIAHRLSEIPAIVRAQEAKSQDVQIYLWNLDGEEAAQTALGAIDGRLVPWKAAWTGVPHFKHLQVTTGEVLFDKRADRVLRPWLRLRCGQTFYSLFANNPSTLLLDRERVQAYFKDVGDGEGNFIYQYFGLKSPMLEFAYDSTCGWQVRVPTDAANGFFLKTPQLASPQEIRNTFTPISPGSRMVLFSRRKNRLVEAATFLITDS